MKSANSVFKYPKAALQRQIARGELDEHTVVSPWRDGPFETLTKHVPLPAAELVEHAIEVYRRAGSEPHEYARLSQTYLALARPEDPGRFLVHLLLYFAHRGVDTVRALDHLCQAGGTIAPNDPRIGAIRNDLGAHFLLVQNRVEDAVRLFELSVRTGYEFTDAGLSNLELLKAVATDERVRLPYLDAALKEAHRQAESAGSVRGNRRSDQPPRPDPRKDNWARYIDRDELKPSALFAASPTVSLSCELGNVLSQAARCPDPDIRGALLAAASRLDHRLEPAANAYQHGLMAERSAEVDAALARQFVEAARHAGDALARRDLEAVSEAIRLMTAYARTGAEKRQVKLLVARLARMRAAVDPESPDALADPVTSPRVAYHVQSTNVQSLRRRITEHVSNGDFEKAIECCESLSTFDSVPRAVSEKEREKVRYIAAQAIDSKVREALGQIPPSFDDAQREIQRARLLEVAQERCEHLEEILEHAMATYLRSQVRRLIAAEEFDKAFAMIREFSGRLPPKG